MEEIALTENRIAQLPLTTLSKRTLSILAANDYGGKSAIIKHYSEFNRPKFNELLRIKDRIPDLVKAAGVNQIGGLLMAEIKKFVDCYTIIRPMNADQMAECAYALIATSEEDRLSLQDFILFFDGAKQGKYGRVLDHIDQHVIFEMLEQYREERHRQNLNIKEENHVKFKGMGDNSRSTDEVDETDMRQVMNDYYKKTVEENQTT